MRWFFPFVVALSAAAGCGTLLDLNDDSPSSAPTDAGTAADDGNVVSPNVDGASDGALEATPEASCGDTSIDSANCGACGRKCNAGGACVSGTCDRLVVFITSTTTAGVFKGAEADKQCNDLAKAADLGGTFRVWTAGPGTTNRFKPAVTVPYHRSTGERVATQWPPGVAALEQSISFDEKRGEHAGALVWSELDGNGDPTAINDCLGWANPAANQQGGYGKASATDSTWTMPPSISDVQTCNQALHLYCVEKP